MPCRHRRGLLSPAASNRRAREQGSGEREHEPGKAPAARCNEADQRLPDDPGRRLTDERKSEHRRPLLRRNPCGRGERPRRGEGRDAGTDRNLCSGEQGQAGRGRAHERSEREQHRAAEELPLQPDPSAEHGEVRAPSRRRRGPRWFAADRPKQSRRRGHRRPRPERARARSHPTARRTGTGTGRR